MKVDPSVETDPPIESMSPLRAHARLEELQRTGLHGSAGDQPLDQLARVASAVVRAPRSYVTLVTDEHQMIPGSATNDAVVDRVQPLRASLCQFAIATGEPLVINDGERDQLVRHTDPVRSGDVGAYAGIPLRTRAGHVLGTLCVIDSRPREWEPQEIELLQDLAAIAIRDIQHRIDAVREARIFDLAAQLARATLAAEDALTPLVSATEEQEQPRLQRYAALTRLRMDQAMSTSRELSAVLAGQQREQPLVGGTEANLVQTVQRAVRSAAAATGSAQLSVNASGTSLLVKCEPVPLEHAVTHLIVTALHYATGEEHSQIHLGLNGKEVRLILTAPGSMVPTAELARVVARFSATAVEHSSDEEDEEQVSTIRVVRGGVVVHSGRVQARTSPDGLRFIARWPLAVH